MESGINVRQQTSALTGILARDWCCGGARDRGARDRGAFFETKQAILSRDADCGEGLADVLPSIGAGRLSCERRRAAEAHAHKVPRLEASHCAKHYVEGGEDLVSHQ